LFAARRAAFTTAPPPPGRGFRPFIPGQVYADRVTEPTMPMQYPGWEPPGPDERTVALPTRRRRRRGRRWLIALVAVIALLIAADRIALVVAEDQLASRIQSSQHLAQKPSVGISGFPFLTQVLARDFNHATVDIHGLDANGLTVSDLHADLYGVHVNGAFNGATVDTLDATAVIDYADIASALSKQVSVAGQQVGAVQVAEDGPGQLKATYSVLGVSFSAVIAITLSGPNTLRLHSTQLSTSIAGLGFNPNIDQSFDLSGLPFGISLTDLTYTSSAVQVSAVAHNVDLTNSGISTGTTGG
jgi:hypothetical protein